MSEATIITSPYPFRTVLEVMKPNSIDKNNPNAVKRLEACFASSEYIVEEKIDGHHYLCIAGRFFSTHIGTNTGWPVEKTDNFPHLAEAFFTAGLGFVILDGEINYPGKKSQDVSAASNSGVEKAILYQEKHGWVKYTVYDILRAANGEWLVHKPWRQRREYLEAVGAKLAKYTPHVIVNPVVFDKKREFVDQLLEVGKEGGVLKSVSGLYILGERPAWNQIKVKQELEDDVVLMGSYPPTKIYTGKEIENWPYWEEGEPVTEYHYKRLLGSLRIGKFRDGALIELGSISGMTLSERVELTTNMSQYIGQVVRIKGMEKTRDGSYRHFTFVEMHPDKNSRECTL